MIRDTETPFPAAGEPKKHDLKATLQAFPIGKYHLLASCAFWLFLLYGSYKLFGVYQVATVLDDSALEDSCLAMFGVTVAENVNKVKAYPNGSAVPYLGRLGSVKQKTGEFIGRATPKDLEKLPPFLTAVSPNDVEMSLGLIKHMSEQKVYLIIYVFNLSNKQNVLMSESCVRGTCEMRHLNEKIYPDHLAGRGTEAWQPIIMQLVLEEFGSVVWITPAQRISHKESLNRLIHRRENEDFFVWESKEKEILAYTNLKMFVYLDEIACLYRDKKMVDMNLMVLYRTPNTWEMFMKPWLKCHMTQKCVAPEGSYQSGCFHFRYPRHTGCHNYEQSAISIILTRVLPMNSIRDRALFKVTETILVSEVSLTSYSWPFSILTLTVLIIAIYYYRRRKFNARFKSDQYRRR